MARTLTRVRGTGLRYDLVINYLRRARRQLPRPVRLAALRLLGRTPRKRERIIRIRLPSRPLTASDSRTDRSAPESIAIPTRPRTFVSRRLEASGLAGYEPDTLACFLAAIDSQNMTCVYDVGANIGVFSWLAAAFGRARVVAFEPTPVLAERMRSICSANGLAVTVEDVALGSAVGNATLYLSDVTDSSNSLRDGFRPSRQSVPVQVQTIDHYAAATGHYPELVKIDTESTEPDVLRGAVTVLTEHRPWLICEVLAGLTEADLSAILGPLGYHYFRIDHQAPLRRSETIEGDPTYAHMNWLFAPSEPGRDFWQAMTAWRASLSATRPWTWPPR